MVESPKDPKAAGQRKRPRQQAQTSAAPVAKSGWLGSLKIWQKLLSVAVGFLVPVVLVLGLLVGNQNAQIAFSAKEQIGARYLVPLVGLLDSVQRQRGLTNQVLSGNKSAQANLDKVKQEVRSDLEALKAIDSRFGAELQTKEEVINLSQELDNLITYSSSLNPQDSWIAHTNLIKNRILPLIAKVSNTSNLILDPELDSRWIMAMSVQTLPRFTERLAQLRGYGTGLLAGKSASAEDKNLIQNLVNESKALYSETIQSVDYALGANKSLGPTVAAKSTDLGVVYDLFNLAEGRILQAQQLDYDPSQYFAIGSKAVDKVFGFYQTSLSELERLLGERVQKLQRQQLLQLITVALVLAATFLLVGSIIQRITRPINRLYLASQSISKGNLNVQVPVETTDETGQLARVFNESVEQLKAKAVSDAEAMRQSAQLQHNIGEFLQVAMTIAQGNLTQRGRVTEDVLGNVVDAINLMTEEVGFLLKNVQKAAVQVNQGAAQMDQLTGAIFEGAQEQASETQEMRQDTAQVSQAIRQMAENATDSSQAARQTLEAAQLGREAVTQTLSGMSDIRSEMLGIAENIQTLASRSAEIESIARTLEDFASQTNLLALNASFEAAGAGAVGKRFAIVAEEIRKLAEDSAKETQRVTLLVRQVQSDIGTVVAMTQDGVRGAETGYRVADVAGQRLQEISQFANQSSQLAEQISSLAQLQVSAVTRVDQAVQKIASTAEATEQESLKGRQAAEIMRKLTDQLARNLGRFELPA